MDMAKGSTASLVLMGALLVTASSVLSYGDFARYQSIVSRHPFGDVPVVSVPRHAAPAPTPAAESFAKALRMSAITDSAAGLRVGFSDIKVKPERHYYLGVGDIQDGYHVVDANYAKEGQRILDTHLGSGSNAIAAHYAKMGEFVGCELDRDYFDAACERVYRETRQQELF